MRTPVLLLVAVTLLSGQTENRFQPGIRPFVSINDPRTALVHVRVIDGTGAPATEDQTILIDAGKIVSSGLQRPSPFPLVCGV